MKKEIKKTIIGNREFLWGSRTYVMGIVNLTPDSFSGEGLSGHSIQAALRSMVTPESILGKILKISF